MRRTSIAIFALLMVAVFSVFAAAGTGLRVETQGWDKYKAAGVDTELGFPAVPLHPLVEVLGWYSGEDAPTSHLQAGLGARLYLTAPASGLFVEGKMRYVATFGAESGTSTVLVVGAGYRLRPIIGGIDLYVGATTTEHPVLPKYFIGARVGF